MQGNDGTHTSLDIETPGFTADDVKTIKAFVSSLKGQTNKPNKKNSKVAGILNKEIKIKFKTLYIILCVSVLGGLIFGLLI